MWQTAPDRSQWRRRWAALTSTASVFFRSNGHAQQARLGDATHLMAWNRLAFARQELPTAEGGCRHVARGRHHDAGHRPQSPAKTVRIEMTMQFIAFGPSGMLAAVQNATNRSQSCSVTTRLRSGLLRAPASALKPTHPQ